MYEELGKQILEALAALERGGYTEADARLITFVINLLHPGTDTSEFLQAIVPLIKDEMLEYFGAGLNPFYRRTEKAKRRRPS